MDPASAALKIENLWDAFYGELLAFARRRTVSESDAEDILQTAFLRAHNQLESGTTPTNARGWLYQIVRNLAIDAHRKKVRRREITEHDPGIDLDTIEEPAALNLDDDLRKTVARSLPLFIERLESPYREALQLTEIEGLTQAQAARHVGLSLSGMKSRVQRGRKHLLDSLQACCEFGLDARNRVIACRRRTDDSVC